MREYFVLVYYVMAQLLISASAKAGAEERYICLAEKAVGFAYESTTAKWKETEFNVDHKYVISQVQRAKMEWRVNVISGVKFSTVCSRGFYNNFLNCEDPLLQSSFFRFNRELMRYISVNISGYHNDISLFRETPYMEIGTCSKI